jgi:hypothetical protein
MRAKITRVRSIRPKRILLAALAFGVLAASAPFAVVGLQSASAENSGIGGSGAEGSSSTPIVRSSASAGARPPIPFTGVDLILLGGAGALFLAVGLGARGLLPGDGTV